MRRCKITNIMRKSKKMTKIDPNKIIRAAIGSSQLEGYKGSVKTQKNNRTTRPQSKPKPQSTSNKSQ